MKIKNAIVFGILYVTIVITGYAAITGDNPFETPDFHEHEEEHV